VQPRSYRGHLFCVFVVRNLTFSFCVFLPRFVIFLSATDYPHVYSPGSIPLGSGTVGNTLLPVSVFFLEILVYPLSFLLPLHFLVVTLVLCFLVRGGRASLAFFFHTPPHRRV